MSNGGTNRRWTFTLNNPGAGEEPEAVKAKFGTGKGYRYLVFQLEQGASGTPHYQGLIGWVGGVIYA